MPKKSYKDSSRYIQKLHSGGHWQQLFRDHLSVMSMNEAVVLSYLINIHKQQNYPEWFRCSSKKMIANLWMPSLYSHDRILKSLSDKGLIERRMMGQPAKRYFHIDYEHIHNSVDAALQKACDLDENHDDFSVDSDEE